jgi:KDO2-lipid IV(A) lauroyltransferase
MEELPLPSEPDREAAALALTAALSQKIEGAIRRAPDQWVWMHQRWKTRPEKPPALARD